MRALNRRGTKNGWTRAETRPGLDVPVGALPARQDGIYSKGASANSSILRRTWKGATATRRPHSRRRTAAERQLARSTASSAAQSAVPWQASGNYAFNCPFTLSAACSSSHREWPARPPQGPLTVTLGTPAWRIHTSGFAVSHNVVTSEAGKSPYSRFALPPGACGAARRRPPAAGAGMQMPEAQARSELPSRAIPFLGPARAPRQPSRAGREFFRGLCLGAGA